MWSLATPSHFRWGPWYLEDGSPLRWAGEDLREELCIWSLKITFWQDRWFQVGNKTRQRFVSRWVITGKGPEGGRGEELMKVTLTGWGGASQELSLKRECTHTQISFWAVSAQNIQNPVGVGEWEWHLRWKLRAYILGFGDRTSRFKSSLATS